MNERKPPLPPSLRRKQQRSTAVAAVNQPLEFVVDDTTLDEIVLKDFKRPAWRLMRSASESHLEKLIDYSQYRAADDELDRPGPPGGTTHLAQLKKVQKRQQNTGNYAELLRNPYRLRCNPAWRTRTFRSNCDHTPYHPAAQDLLQALMQQASIGVPRYVMEMVSLFVENIADDLPELTEAIQNLADILSTPSAPRARPSTFVHTVADCIQMLGNIACAFAKGQQRAEKRCLKQEARERSLRMLNTLIAAENNRMATTRSRHGQQARKLVAHDDAGKINLVNLGETDTASEAYANNTADNINKVEFSSPSATLIGDMSQ